MSKWEVNEACMNNVEILKDGNIMFQVIAESDEITREELARAENLVDALNASVGERNLVLERACAAHYESHMALSSGPRFWEDVSDSTKEMCRDNMRRALKALFS